MTSVLNIARNLNCSSFPVLKGSNKDCKAEIVNVVPSSPVIRVKINVITRTIVGYVQNRLC